MRPSARREVAPDGRQRADDRLALSRPNDASARRAWDQATLDAVASVLPEVHAI